MALIALTPTPNPPVTRNPTTREVLDYAGMVSRGTTNAIKRIEQYLQIFEATAAPTATAGGVGTSSVPFQKLMYSNATGERFYGQLFDSAKLPKWKWFLTVSPDTSALADNDLLYYDDDDDVVKFASSATLGLVTGAASSTDNAVARWDGTAGNDIQNSGVIIDDSDNISGIASLQVTTGGAYRTGTTAGNTALLQARDVDGAAWTTFATLTANDTPTMDLAAGVTINSLSIVRGPASSTDNAITRWDGTGGTTVQNSAVVIDDTDNVTGMATLTLTNTGLHLLDTDASHDLIVAPGANLTADRTLTVTTPDAALTLNLSTVTAGRVLRADGTNWLASTATYPDTVTANRLLYASATNTVSDLASANSAVLVTSGAGVPSLATDIPTAVTIGGAYIYRVGGTDVSLADGGTNASLTASDGGIFYSTATAGAILAGTATANQVLLSGSSTTPAWSTATYPASVAVSRLLYASATNVIGDLATANSGVLVTSGTGVPSIATDIPTAVTIGSAYVYRVGGTDVAVADGGTGLSTVPSNGQLLIGNGTGYTLATLTDGTAINITEGAGTITIANTGVTSATGTANQVTVSASTGAVTFSTPQNIHTAATPTFAKMTLAGTTTRMIDVNWNTTGGHVLMSFRNQGTEKWWIRSDDTSYEWALTSSAGAYAVAVNSSRQVGIAMAGTAVAARLHVTEPTVGNEIFRLESTATSNDPNYKVYQGRAATTDATVTTINTIAISASNTYIIEARVVARRTGGTSGTADDGAAYVLRGAYTTKTGTVTLLGALNLDYTAEDQAAWDATLTISGTNVLLQVTGAANNNVTWHSTVFVSNVGS